MSLGFLGTPPRELPLVRGLRERGLLEIVEHHAATHNVTVADIVGERRTNNIARARHAVWREIRATTTLSYVEIGALFGRDHTTVMGACKGVTKVAPPGVRAVLASLRVV